MKGVRLSFAWKGQLYLGRIKLNKLTSLVFFPLIDNLESALDGDQFSKSYYAYGLLQPLASYLDAFDFRETPHLLSDSFLPRSLLSSSLLVLSPRSLLLEAHV